MNQDVSEMKTLLAHIDLDLEEVLEEESKAVKALKQKDQRLQVAIETVIQKVEVELDRPIPDYERLELLKIEYEALLLEKHDVDLQYLIAGETIASIELEEIND